MKQFAFKSLLVAFLYLISMTVAAAQDSIRVIKPNQTGIGIPITKERFDKKVSNYLELMSKWTAFKTTDYIDMVRIYNTIGGALPIKNDFYKEYYTVFLIMYSKLAAKSLKANLNKGMAMYSKKYDIWIGDIPLGNDNSRFNLSTDR